MSDKDTYAYSFLKKGMSRQAMCMYGMYVYVCKCGVCDVYGGGRERNVYVTCTRRAMTQSVNQEIKKGKRKKTGSESVEAFSGRVSFSW